MSKRVKVKITSEETGEVEIIELTEPQKKFCRFYIFEWNATQSYLKAYPDCTNEDSAGASASRLLGNAKIQQYINELQKDIAKVAGISKLKVANEYAKLAFSSMEHYHNTWIEKKEFDELTPDQKACIQEIEFKTVKKTVWEYDEEAKEKKPVPYEVEYVKLKLHDKKGSLDSLSKMFGYNEPDKLDLSNTDGTLKPDLSKYTPEQLHQMAIDAMTIENKDTKT